VLPRACRCSGDGRASSIPTRPLLQGAGPTRRSLLPLTINNHSLFLSFSPCPSPSPYSRPPTLPHPPRQWSRTSGSTATPVRCAPLVPVLQPSDHLPAGPKAAATTFCLDMEGQSLSGSFQEFLGRARASDRTAPAGRAMKTATEPSLIPCPCPYSPSARSRRRDRSPACPRAARDPPARRLYCQRQQQPREHDAECWCAMLSSCQPIPRS
jgi:hypothetical protein